MLFKTVAEIFQEYFSLTTSLISSTELCEIAKEIFWVISSIEFGSNKKSFIKVNSDIAVLLEQIVGILAAIDSKGGIPKPSAKEGYTAIVAPRVKERSS